MILFSCKKTEIAPDNIFTRIYEDSNSDISYYPLDFKQTPDGYLVLASTSIDTTRTWLKTFIMKTGETGEHEWSVTLDMPYVNPVSNLISIGSDYYFFSMDAISLGAHLLRINESGQTAELVQSFPEILYPLAASKTSDNGFLVLGYDRETRQTSITKISSSFSVQWQSKYNVSEDTEEQIVDHLIKTGRNIPFFTGSVEQGGSGYYFVNGFINYTLSIIFVNSSNGDRTGIAQGFRYDGGASALMNLQGNTFSLSRFSFGEHFLLSQVDLDMNSITSLGDIGGSKLAEIADDAEVRISKILLNDKPAIVFATNTNNNQVILYIYDLNTGELLVKKYLGFNNPVKISSVMQTSDNGLAVLVQTMVTGRFKRICIYKIPKEHLTN